MAPPSAAGSGYGTGSEVFGQIVEEPEQGGRLSLDRLEQVEVGRHRSPGRERLQASLQADGRIVDDYLDGLRVYGHPPHYTRPAHRADRLLARLGAWTLPFVVIAALQGVATGADAAGSARWTAESVLSLACQLGYTVLLALLPAAVLIWRKDAWRSARLVLVGAVVWTTVPAAVGLVWWLLRRSPSLAIDAAPTWSAVISAAVIVSCVGPLLVALGLEQVRLNRARWLLPTMARVGVVGAPLLLINGPRWVPPASAAVDPLVSAWSFWGFVLPLELLFSLTLAASCLSAAVALEPQKRLWQFGAVGAVMLSVLAVDAMSSGVLPTIMGPAGMAGQSWSGVWVDAMLLAGSGCILLAFTSPVWSTARDAFASGGAAPETVFAWGPDALEMAGEPVPMTTIVALAAGRDHALALDDQGHVGAWGDDSAGQTDTPPGLSDVIAIAAGDGFSMALQADGSIVAWGANDHGQASVPQDLGAVVAIAAGGDYALALRADGTVVGWGDPSGLALAVPDWLAGVTAISAGDDHALALCGDGTVVAWGNDTWGQASVPARLTRVSDISAGGNFSLALLADGTVAAWGDDSYGQLDIPRGLGHVIAISAGAFHALALRADGDVVGWGGGQRRGDSGRPWRLVDFKAVAAGDGFSLAVRVAYARLLMRLE
jgi:hypothetical protein